MEILVDIYGVVSLVINILNYKFPQFEFWQKWFRGIVIIILAVVIFVGLACISWGKCNTNAFPKKAIIGFFFVFFAFLCEVLLVSYYPVCHAMMDDGSMDCWIDEFWVNAVLLVYAFIKLMIRLMKYVLFKLKFQF